MKNFLAIILLFITVINFSSCDKNSDATTSSIIVPPVDSVSLNSTITLYYRNDTFIVHDLAVKNVPIEVLTGSTMYNSSDSIWQVTILLTDKTNTEISMNLTAYNATSNAVGTYYVTTNSSTFTDYTTGQNRTYSVMEGSYITITQLTNPLTGTLGLTLHYNNDTLPATGSFGIYQ